MLKKLNNLFLIICFLILITGCRSKDTLLFLNWGEYIDEDLITEFENQYNCTVVMDLADSNEAFYSKVSSGTTVYDVVAPSDYMVIKMKKNDLLSEIDFSKLSNYNQDDLLVGVKGIISKMNEKEQNIDNYFVPYLWGTWGIMYSTKKEGLKEAVVNNKNEWASLFDRSSLPMNTKLAMYDSNQHAYYAACKYLGLDNNIELANEDLDKIYELIKKVNYNARGTDDLKKKIAAENLDLGFMWTGDFLYYYCERIAEVVYNAYKDNSNINILEMIQSLVDDDTYTFNNKIYQVGFDMFIPNDTIAFCDNLVITKKAAHKDLAHKFIDYMCKVQSAFKNAYYVVYDTPFKNVYDEIVALEDSSIDDVDQDLLYDIAIGYGYNKYYPKTVNNENGYKGDILAPFDRKYINKINAIFNNARF